MDDFAAVGDQFYLGDQIVVVGIEQGDLDVQGLRLVFFGEDGSHGLAVYGVADLQVLVLSCVNSEIANRIVDALLREVVGEDYVSCVVGVAPTSFVVVLVVGGCHVPAVVQSQYVLLIAGIVSACSNLAFAVTNLYQEDVGVSLLIPV